MRDISSSAHGEIAVRTTATRLRVSMSAFMRRTRDAAAEGDLTGPEMAALSRLDRSGPGTTADLARWEQITAQAMGATIGSLERGGLVARTPDATDGRRSVVALTEAGRTALGEGRSAIVDRIAAALAESFTPDEIAVLDAAAPLIQRVAERL
ncbi:MarR family winged helix-turn-helix transcriptional regulator [Streptomyces sp. NPDC002574]|uniref:MarR family winged helix-turn-helix transcriptional regulator n=1 Tax=Streptomyces sp. NPDC002574 TaxID=3364652 RepID=UPI0036844142